MSDLENLRAQLRAATARAANGKTSAERMAALQEIDDLAPKLVEATKGDLEVGLKMIVNDLTASLRPNDTKE